MNIFHVSRLNISLLFIALIAAVTTAISGTALAAPEQIQYGTATMTSCSKEVVKSGHRGNCGKVLQKRLKDLGFYAGSVDGIVGTGTLNGVLNYQRSQHLADDAIVGQGTWARLRANPQPAVKDIVPKACYNSGRVACVSKATRTASFYKNGTRVKSIKVRIGGWTDDRTGKMRVHHTVKGTYTVFNKDKNPSSVRYGEGAMPLSVMFDPNMYFHYSAGFARDGYMKSSHGCVNIASRAEAEWVFGYLQKGDKVIVY